jgi:tetratricopeptide (TPR) repeat protein
MLDLLVHRCLVFRMEQVHLGPKDVMLQQLEDLSFSAGQQTDVPPTDTGWRFTIHRFLQRTILEHLKSPFVEFPKVDQFGLSLWATQPDELPRPDRSAAHDISGLVAAWIGFPKSTEVMRTTSTFHWFKAKAEAAAERLLKQNTDSWKKEDCLEEWRDATLPARMLRAALGVLRATYSVGVVSRFHDFDDDGAGLTGPDEGYFKQHHLQVRWLLEQAKLLATAEGSLSRLCSKVEVDPKLSKWWGLAKEALAPFYDDELVWLNNECGLFCLVEGRLENAAGMFRQALIAAEGVEGTDPQGALWCRIHLNLAIVDIERGRIREADEKLAVIEGVADENPVLRILARGFRGLVEHLSGNLGRAETIYVKVLDDLVPLHQLRAVAIFSRHLAELYRLRGASTAVKAFHAIEQSISAATKGGHEDIRHLAVLSRVRLSIAGVLPAEVLARSGLTIQSDLDAVERYSHVMGMPRLLADVAFARALYLLRLGETRHAARMAYQCLGLCGANGLRLRQMTALALLGRIYSRRGRPTLAEPLFEQAYAMAAECHYGNMREVASNVTAWNSSTNA